MPRTALALRHVHFEDLGTFRPVLEAAGYAIRLCDAGVDTPAPSEMLEADLVVVLGGPVAVYDGGRYPVLDAERDALSDRLAADRPTLGVCLGAQLMAAALGATVAPMGGTEIGFAPVALSPAGRAGPLRHLEGVPVLHWHGDAFALPPGADRLAHTDLCANQAFARGPSILGLQFHPEADAGAGFERWLIGHAHELAANGVDPRRLRADAAAHGAALRDAGRAMLAEWLEGLPS